jgi:hypothetical protein
VGVLRLIGALQGNSDGKETGGRLEELLGRGPDLIEGI